jgi:two-component system, LuxR family, sensor kinase FixL
MPIIVAMANELSHDIIRAVQLSDDLRESEKSYLILFESAPVGIMLIGADGHILKANYLQARLYGYESPQQLEGMSPLLFISEKDRKTAAQNMRTLLHVNELPDRIYTAVRRDGTEFFIELTSIIIRGSHQDVKGCLYITRDISKSKEGENERIQLRHELAHLSRVMAMNELSTSLAHEINQPLGAILNNASAVQILISSMKERPDVLSEILKDIIQDTQRAGDVIRKIRGIVKKSEALFEPLSMNDLIEDAARLLQNNLNINHISLFLELQQDLVKVMGDRVHLHQVLMNFITNAVDALTGCPLKTLTIRSCMIERNMVMVSVADSGKGIVMENNDLLFEAFYTTKKDGLGMGLRICRSIIEEHGGRIWAENNQAGGATFSFSLKSWGGESE